MPWSRTKPSFGEKRTSAKTFENATLSAAQDARQAVNRGICSGGLGGVVGVSAKDTGRGRPSATHLLSTAVLPCFEQKYCDLVESAMPWHNTRLFQARTRVSAAA